MNTKDIPEILELSTSEKILFLEDLWETISNDEENIGIPKSHREELDRRLHAPGELLTLEDLQMRIKQRK